jgi:CRP-like cAMP-binding protein
MLNENKDICNVTFTSMDYSILQGYIKKVTKNVSDEDLSLLVSCAVNRKLKKGESLLKEGELCRSFYLVDKGYLRNYYNKEGVSINLNFTFEGEFTTNLKSIKSRKPSEIIIEAGENASVWIFNLNTKGKQYNSNPIINLFILAIQNK